MRPILKITEYSAKLAEEYNLLGLVTDGYGWTREVNGNGQVVLEEDVDADPFEYAICGPDSCVPLLVLLPLLVVPLTKFQFQILLAKSVPVMLSCRFLRCPRSWFQCPQPTRPHHVPVPVRVWRLILSIQVRKEEDDEIITLLNGIWSI